MEAARALIADAKEGILFLFFNPGTKNTLYDAVTGMIGNAAVPDFFVRGIINQDPGGKVNPLVFIHKGDKKSTNFDTVIPKNINDEFGYWTKEIHPQMVTIHSKVVIIDPFGENPVVMTGSHNMGEKASKVNDDNLNIIRGNKSLAQQYAVNILSVYDNYNWRYSLSLNNAGSKAFTGLTTDVNWMNSYLTPAHINELKFMLG